MAESLYTQAGIIRFYDGTIIAIEGQEYSPDGLTNWETVFNPSAHLSSLDGVTPIDGHKYKRVMHSGDISWQMPYKIVAETPEFRISEDGLLEWKFEDETVWNLLIDTDELKGDAGEQGEQGIPGEGFNIDLYGFYQARPDCSDALISSCNTCNPGTTDTPSSSTFMSLGDGVLVLTQILITANEVVVDAVTYTHFSNDLVTWTAISAGIVDFEARYLAMDDTGAVYTDMQTEDYYGTRGVVYICAEGNWTVLTNVATPSYMVGEANGNTNIGFLDNFVTASANTLVGSIALNVGLFEIIEQSLTENALIQTMFGDGIEILTPMAKPQINASDFAGFGLANYTSGTDSLDDIQVDATVLVGNGIAAQAAVAIDGETRNLFQVNPSDLINNDSGIIATAQGDTFEDLMINLGNGLVLDGGTPQAITIDTDELSLVVDATSLRVKAYAAGNDGIMLQHLNPDVIWSSHGFALDVLNGLYVTIDGATIGYAAAGGVLEVPDNGITGDKLNDDAANNLLGIEILNDALAVRVDGSTIDFNGSGQLEYIGALGTQVISITSNDNGITGNTVNDNVILRANDTSSISANIVGDAGSDTLTLDFNVIQGWLDSQIDARIALGSSTYWDALEKNSGETTTIEEYVTALNHVELDTQYGTAQVIAGTGVVLTASSGERYQLIVDANGNLDTVLIP